MPTAARRNLPPWMVLAFGWVVIAVLLLVDSRVARDYYSFVDGVGLRGAPASGTPLRHTVPYLYADAQAWVLHAIDLAENGGTRVRFTHFDNAPDGREVHWSSPLVWLLAATGKLRAAVTGEPVALAIEAVVPWLTLIPLLAAIMALSAWTMARAGLAAALVIAWGMAGHHDFFDGFAPYCYDHHGLITTAILGMLLGTLWMGAGWWQPGSPSPFLPASAAAVKSAAVGSALCGALGMWISAASVIPAFVFIAFACLGTVFFWGRDGRTRGLQFSADAWRLWGRVGAIASFACYLLEYAPAHLGLRLEVNHPVYALAWWGGAELLALISEWRLHGSTVARRPAVRRWGPPLAAVALAPACLVIGGISVFAVRDPFVGKLSNHVLEGLSFPALIRLLGPNAFFAHFNTDLLPLLPAFFFLLTRDLPVRLTFGYLLLATCGFLALACWEVRFWQSAAAPMLALTVLTFATLGPLVAGPRRTAIIVALAAALFLPDAISRAANFRERLHSRTITPQELAPNLQRDLASALRASQPDGDIVLLSCPTTALGIAYYGRFKTLGTLYWENARGLRAAAEIFCAETDDEARALLQARGITHVVLTSEEDFLLDLFVLLRPRAPVEEFRRTFGYRLFHQQKLPLWLRLLPYAPPPDLRRPDLRVLALQVVPDQPEPIAYHHIAVAQLVKGEPDRAERAFLAGLARSAASERAAYALAAGNYCYQYGARAAAIRLFRAGLAEESTPALALNLAWLLATATDDALRQPTEALALARRYATVDSTELHPLNVLAAAAAANGQFADAAALARRSLALARAASDPNVALFERRLEAYESGRPWRQ